MSLEFLSAEQVETFGRTFLSVDTDGNRIRVAPRTEWQPIQQGPE